MTCDRPLPIAGGDASGSNGVRHVVFDLGGVILRWRPEEVLRQEISSAEARRALAAAMFHHADWKELDRGVIDEPEAARRFSDRTGVSADVILHLIGAARRSLTLKQDTLDLARALKAVGKGLYCLSNLSSETWRHLKRRFDFWEIFDGVVASCTIRLVKPDPKIYEHLLNTYRLDPGATVFFDDLEENVMGARHMGMHAFVFRSARDARRILRDQFGFALAAE